MTVTLPLDSNIPPHWIKSATVEKAIIPMPSRSVPGLLYDVELDYATRELECKCKGFDYRGSCGHLAALKFSSYKPKSKKKGVADTSIESIYKFTPEDLGKNQKAVYDCLAKHGPMSNKQIGKKMREEAMENGGTGEEWPINTITPRVKENRNMGFIEEYGTQYDSITKRREIVWEIVS